MILIEKFLKEEIISYLFFGFLTTILNFSLFFVFERFLYHNKSFINNLIAWFFSIIFAYITSNKFIFKMKFKGIRSETIKILKFICSRLLSLSFEEIGILIFIKYL